MVLNNDDKMNTIKLNLLAASNYLSYLLRINSFVNTDLLGNLDAVRLLNKSGNIKHSVEKIKIRYDE